MAHIYPEFREMISGRTRLIAYMVFAVIGLALGSIQVGYAAAEAGQPVWLTVALAVYAYLGVGFGYTAGTHVPKDQEAARLRG